VRGCDSTRTARRRHDADYIAGGEQTTLTLMGYDIAADTNRGDHFLLG
jgi:hypothetical protein